MVDYDAPLYQNPPEVWDEKTCAKKARHRAKDGLGSPYPFLGYIGSHYGEVRYNGGCERNGQWWQGENFPFPIVHENYEIVAVPTWGYRIVKKTPVQQRLEYLRQELRAERISYAELAELQSLARHIQSNDVELLEAAGVPESNSR